jgi:hypothetical protein
MLSAMPKEEQMRSAAISCSICVEIYAGLEICQRDIQDQHGKGITIFIGVLTSIIRQLYTVPDIESFTEE